MDENRLTVSSLLRGFLAHTVFLWSVARCRVLSCYSRCVEPRRQVRRVHCDPLGGRSPVHCAPERDKQQGLRVAHEGGRAPLNRRIEQVGRFDFDFNFLRVYGGLLP